MPILLRIETYRAMQPHRSPFVKLEQQLIEVYVLLNELEVLLTLFHGVDTDIHRLTRQVL